MVDSSQKGPMTSSARKILDLHSDVNKSFPFGSHNYQFLGHLLAYDFLGKEIDDYRESGRNFR